MKRLVISLLFATAAAAQAQVTVSDPWVRGTVAQQKSTGAFMVLSSASDVRLTSAQSPVAGVVEIHEMVMEGDVMKMRQIPGLDIAKDRAAYLKPGGYHVMLMELKQQLKGGDVVPITLVFEDSASKKQFTQEVKAPVSALGAGKAAPTQSATDAPKH